MSLSREDEVCGSRRAAGCRGSCRVRLHDGCPARDVPGRDVVGGASEPAPLAAEVIPAGTVPLADVAALRAFPRRVARVHQSYRDASDGGLIGDELAEPVKAPGVRVTMAEIECAIDGRDLPDVRPECPACRPLMQPPLAVKTGEKD